MASAFKVSKEQARKLESVAYAADDGNVYLGAQDENGTIRFAFKPGYRQPDVDRIQDYPLTTAENGFQYRKVTEDGTMRLVRGGRGPRS